MDFEEAFKLVDAAVVFQKKRHLKDIEVAILRGAWSRKKYYEIAASSGYTTEYLKQDVGPKLWKLLSEVLEEKVSKTNFQTALERRSLFFQKSMALLYRSETYLQNANSLVKEGQNSTRSQLNAVAKPRNLLSDDLGIEVEAAVARGIPKLRIKGDTSSQNSSSQVPSWEAKIQTQAGWRETVNVSSFYGRAKELALLKQWISKERCHIVAILGMGGVGKTALSICIAKQLQNEFEHVIWRSLRHPPVVEELLADLIAFLSNQQEVNLTTSLHYGLSRLLHYLRSSRCLLVLDRVETILSGGDRTGYYQEGYEGYSELIKLLGEANHHSCLLLTSREKPKEISFLEGQKVRSLQLNSLNDSEIQKIFSEMTTGLEEEWKVIIERYASNPLALKIFATLIRDLLDSNLSKFTQEGLKQGWFSFEDIRKVFEQQFHRLTGVETLL